MPPIPPSPSPARRGGLLLAALGAAVSWAALITYFLVVPRWEDLRDSGLPNVLLGAAGVAVSAAGVLRAAGRRRRAAWALAGAGALAAGALAFYIHVLSYRLPPPERALAVGSAAPPFALPDQDGRERRLEEFRGRWLVLVFFRGSW
jgi:hypothetical protein